VAFKAFQNMEAVRIRVYNSALTGAGASAVSGGNYKYGSGSGIGGAVGSLGQGGYPFSNIPKY